jgi:hypothetical protein
MCCYDNEFCTGLLQKYWTLSKRHYDEMERDAKASIKLTEAETH